MVLSIAMIGLGVLFTRGGPVQPVNPSVSSPSIQVTNTATGDDLSAAIVALQERLSQLPDDHAGWASLGTAYVQQAAITGDPTYYPKARGALRRSMEIKPERNSDALTGMAALAAAQHDFPMAVRHARAAQKINPFSASNQGILSDALEQLGRYDEAQRQLQRMLNLQPGVPSFTRASYAFEVRGQLGAAKMALTRALDQASRPSDQAYCLYYLGELAWNAGQLDRADSYYARGLRLDPSYTSLLAGRAKVAAARGQVQKAVQRYDEVVRRLPTPTFLIEYADLLRSLGREEAADRQEAVLTATQTLFEEQGVDVGAEIALFEADRGRAEAALLAARTTWERQRSTEAADTYAWALHVSGRNVRALEYAKRAGRLGTESALFAFHRGMIEKALSRPADARASLARALDINPYFSPLLAPRARAALDQLSTR
ncbi:MAG: hypothetical protein M3419_10170 [Actinomycetota bacterium]|nr:hypothetical protein [Actinomycetota bacterium]